MRFLLVYALPSPYKEFHQELIEEVAQRFGTEAVVLDGLPPHLTLKYWFEADETQQVELIEYVRSFAATHIPAPMQLGGIDAFTSTVFTKVAATPAARAIFIELIKGLHALPWLTWGKFDGPDMHFHATIASYLSPARTHEIRSFLENRSNGAVLAFDNLTLIGRTTPADTAQGDVHILGSFAFSPR